MRARRWSSRRMVTVTLLGAVLVLTLGMLPAVASPAVAAEAQAQEAPSGSDASDEEGLGVLDSFQSLPVWVQATVVSAAASLTGFALIELVRLSRRRWRRRHFGSNPPLIVQGLLPTVSGQERPTAQSRLAALGNQATTHQQQVRDPVEEALADKPLAEDAVVEEPVVGDGLAEEPVLDAFVSTPVPELKGDVPIDDVSDGSAPADSGVTPPDQSDEDSTVPAKMRIYELARELGLESNDVLTQARALGLEAKAAISSIDHEAAVLLRRFYAGQAPEAVKQGSEAAEEQIAEVTEEPAIELVPAGPPTASVPEDVSVGDLALAIGQEDDAVLRELLKSGIPTSPTDPVPSDLIEEIGETFGYTITIESAEPEPASAEPEPVPEVESDRAVAVEDVPEMVPEPLDLHEGPVVEIEVDLTPAPQEPVPAPKQVAEVSEGLSEGAMGGDGENGSADLVVDLTRFEEKALQPDSEQSPNGSPIEPAYAEAVSSERAGLFGTVRGAFVRNRGGHIHRFVEAPAGKGLVRQICSQCGYVSIGVVSSTSDHSQNGPESSS